MRSERSTGLPVQVRSRRQRRYVTSSVGTLLSVLVVLAGCGAGESASWNDSGKDLSEGDKKVCDAAYQRDARGVYSVTSLADDEEIKKHAKRIKFGTSDAADQEAMAEIRKLCADGGYTAEDSQGG